MKLASLFRLLPVAAIVNAVLIAVAPATANAQFGETGFRMT